MKWKWVIRGLAMAVLALCLAAWGVSYWKRVYVMHYESLAGINGGCLILNLDRGGADAGAGSSWELSVKPADAEGLQDAYLFTQHHWAGFAYHHSRDSKQNWLVLAPLWFPSLVAAALLWMVERKMRARGGGKTAQGEAAEKGAKQS